jgi:hypothetical protein
MVDNKFTVAKKDAKELESILKRWLFTMLNGFKVSTHEKGTAFAFKRFLACINTSASKQYVEAQEAISKKETIDYYKESLNRHLQHKRWD